MRSTVTGKVMNEMILSSPPQAGHRRIRPWDAVRGLRVPTLQLEVPCGAGGTMDKPWRPVLSPYSLSSPNCNPFLSRLSDPSGVPGGRGGTVA